MEEKEFNTRVNSVNLLATQTATLKKELTDEINNMLVSKVSTYVSSLNSRDNDFSKYLNLLKDFDFADKLLSPSDYFSGIKSISSTADPKEISEKSEQMKQYAMNIENNHNNSTTLCDFIIKSLKRSIAIISELQILENQVYDANLDILQDLDSIYDIGKIKKAK